MSDEEDALAREIAADARKRAERTRRRAEREAEELIAEAERYAEDERERALAEAERRIEHERELNEARIAQEIARLRVRLRQQMLQRVRDEAEERLAELADGPEHHDSLVQLAVLAIAAMGGSHFRLAMRAADRNDGGDALAAEVCEAARRELGRAVAAEPAERDLEAIGGLMAESADGHEVADQTYDARLERLWDEIRRRIAGMLPDMNGPDQ
jgi:vacuolar-type H+-ATPase subunit E/Vma4